MIYSPITGPSIEEAVLMGFSWKLDDTLPDIGEHVYMIDSKIQICLEKGFIPAKNKQFSSARLFINCESGAYGICPNTFWIFILYRCMGAQVLID